MRIFRNHSQNQYVKGQAVLEYTGLLVLVALALSAFAMRSYLQNSIMSRMRQDMARPFGTEQYSESTTSVNLNRTVAQRVTVERGVF